MKLAEPLAADRRRDALTGLPGVDALRGRLAEWLARPGDDPVPVHALLLGLRRFETVNLAFGTSAGDGALIEVAARLSHFAASELDGHWVAARSGGGNFLLIARESCSRERWQLFGEQLADIIARPIPSPTGVLRLSPRVALLRGLAGEELDSMLDQLGQTLDGLQRPQGRRLAWADGEVRRAGTGAGQLEADLLAAIDREEIEIVFQPQFALADDRLTGAEALARWRHPRLGRIGAGALFSVAERMDHVAPLSRHIAERALGLARAWPDGPRLSLNVTPSDLATPRYVDDLTGLIAASGFSPARLTLEVTEQTLLHDVGIAARMFADLSGQGIRIALDDFGAGFCNFRYLKLLPLHYLKLDRSMVDGIVGDPRDLAVLRAIIAMAHALDLKVIVEGIESEAQRAVVAAEGCEFYQGFLKAAPMAAEDFLRLAG